jgi:hydroxymethylglutaryl-CoA reductase
LHFVVNGRRIVVPMVTEEPSVIAACSSAAKTISEHGGFTTRTSDRNWIDAQIQLHVSPDRGDAAIATVCA